jgi:hypothetical protein
LKQQQREEEVDDEDKVKEGAARKLAGAAGAGE